MTLPLTLPLSLPLTLSLSLTPPPTLTPNQAHVTRWGADPYSFGSYSFDRVGSSAAHRAALRAPEPEPGSPELGARLFFAGEVSSVPTLNPNP